MDDFHWCYEGDCGPEFWETRFEVYLRIENFGGLLVLVLVFDKEAQDCAGESQSPIDVEWPENSLENAQPGELNFEGYDRVRNSKCPTT